MHEILGWFRRMTQPSSSPSEVEETDRLSPLEEGGRSTPLPPTHLLDDLAAHSFALQRQGNLLDHLGLQGDGDLDKDGIPDSLDSDIDGDRVEDIGDANINIDTDGDGQPD